MKKSEVDRDMNDKIINIAGDHPAWLEVLPMLMEAHTFLTTKQDSTEEDSEKLSILREELTKMARSADMMNEYAVFIQNVFEIAFGDDAINKDYTNQEVLDKLDEFSALSLLAGEVENEG